MMHHFDVAVAAKVGVHAAVLFDNIFFWVEKNRANGDNIHDGKAWVYNSRKAFAELFPYMTDQQVRRGLERLKAYGMIETGNFNKSPYDRTLWYSVSDFGYSIGRKCPITWGENAQPIPDNKPDTNPPLYSPPEGEPTPKRERKRFTPPKLEEVEAYCRERNNSVDASRFLDYYEAVGWKVGKQPMKDWKAAVRTWERRDASNASSQAKKEETYRAPVCVGFDEEGRGIYK